MTIFFGRLYSFQALILPVKIHHWPVVILPVMAWLNVIVPFPSQKKSSECFWRTACFLKWSMATFFLQ